MTPAREPDLWKDSARRLQQAERVAVLSDFDGTLAPIVPHPSAARLPDSVRQGLKRLARCARARVVLVSGRPLADLRRLARVRGLWYVGSHGLETARPGARRVLHASPAECREMKNLARRLQSCLRSLGGVWVERKPASVTIHFRQARPGVARRARRIAQEEVRRTNPAVRLQAGKKVFEFLPVRDVSKATAVVALLAHWPRPGRGWLIFYLGDDAADERVFQQLGRRAISICVGRRRTRAHYRLATPAAVGAFLNRLAGVLECA